LVQLHGALMGDCRGCGAPRRATATVDQVRGAGFVCTCNACKCTTDYYDDVHGAIAAWNAGDVVVPQEDT